MKMLYEKDSNVDLIKSKDLLKTNKTTDKVKKFLKDDKNPNFKIND